jgi:virginiamycin B lyase
VGEEPSEQTPPATGSAFILHRVSGASEEVQGMAATRDGSVWCTAATTASVVRLGSDGSTRTIELDGASAGRVSLAPATAESVWAADAAGNRILLIGATGILWSADVPTADAGVCDIVGLDDGSAWFIEGEADAIGHVDILGRVTEYDTGVPGGLPTTIASDGSSLWFSLSGAGAVAHGRGGDSLPRVMSLGDPRASPTAIDAGENGSLWFADPGRALIGRLERDGKADAFPIAEGTGRPGAVAADVDGGCWFTIPGSDAIGHIDRYGRNVSVALPRGSSAQGGIAVASSGSVWVVLNGGLLGELRDPAGLLADIH